MDEKILIALLAEVADLEEDLALAETTLAHHTSRTRDLRELQAEYEEDAALARQGDQDAGVRLRGKESEIRATEAALALKRDQIIGCADSRQYQALQREINGLAQKVSALEDEALNLLTEVEAAAGGSEVAETDRVRQEQRGQAEINRLSAEAQLATAARDELAVKLEDRLGLLPEVVRRHVLRLRQKGGQAMARVKGGACGGCFAQLPAQKALDADRGRHVVRCGECARYVVHPPWHQT